MREEGYYWVKLHGNWSLGKYIIWQDEDRGSDWLVDDAYYYESTLDEIDEKQIKRE